jgi:hypothetical protein
MKDICSRCDKSFERWRIMVRELGYAPLFMICKKCAGLFDGFPNLRWLEFDEELFLKWIKSLEEIFDITLFDVQLNILRREVLFTGEMRINDYKILF